MTPVEKRYHDDQGSNSILINKRKHHGDPRSFINSWFGGYESNGRKKLDDKGLRKLIENALKVDPDIIVHIFGENTEGKEHTVKK